MYIEFNKGRSCIEYNGFKLEIDSDWGYDEDVVGFEEYEIHSHTWLEKFDKVEFVNKVQLIGLNPITQQYEVIKDYLTQVDVLFEKTKDGTRCRKYAVKQKELAEDDFREIKKRSWQGRYVMYTLKGEGEDDETRKKRSRDID